MAFYSTSKALSLIFDRSLLDGEIHVYWKIANVVPTFKKSSNGDKKNYRQFSLTLIVCTLLESIIRGQV